MKYIKESTLIVTITIILYIILFLQCCAALTSEDEPIVIEEHQLVITADYDYYIYQDKVKVTNTDVRDNLVLKITTWDYEPRTILSGDFYRVGCHDGKLFILNEDFKYYIFDIDSYTPLAPHLTVEDDEYIIPDYELVEMSIEEFKERYPDYKSYYWRSFYEQ